MKKKGRGKPKKAERPRDEKRLTGAESKVETQMNQWLKIWSAQ